MKKIPFILLALLLAFLPAASARADAAPPEDPSTVGISPDFAYLPTKVRMVSEKVTMVLGESVEIIGLYSSFGANPHSVLDVTAEFYMENMGDVDETMKVMFPLTGTDGCYQDPYAFAYAIRPQSFWVTVDGISANYEEIVTDNPNGDPYCDPVSWASFEVVFPVDQSVLITVGYRMMDTSMSGDVTGLFGFRYILETGAPWYGTIGQVDINFVAMNDLTEENAWATPAIYIYDGNMLRWHWDDLEPTRADNIYVHVISSRTWEKITALRNLVAADPENAQAWYELGWRYKSFSYVYYGHGDRLDNLRFANLAEEAYLKALEYDPANAEYHYSFADYLMTRCMVQSDNLNVTPSTELSYCNAAVYEANYAWNLDPGNEYYCYSDWRFSTIRDYTSPCPTPTNDYTPTRTPSRTPINTPTRTNRPTSTPFPTWRPSGTSSPSTVPTVKDKISAFPILIFAFGSLAVGAGVILFIRKRKHSQRG